MKYGILPLVSNTRNIANLVSMPISVSELFSISTVKIYCQVAFPLPEIYLVTSHWGVSKSQASPRVRWAKRRLSAKRTHSRKVRRISANSAGASHLTPIGGSY
jgi:hypothetical protein